MRSVLFALTVSFFACGDNNATPTVDAAKGTDGSMQHDAPGVTTMASIPLPGFANGLYWDSSASKLYFTDKAGTNFDSWTDAGGVATVASLSAITAVNPGGIVKLADGSFVTPNFSTNDTMNGVIQINGSTATLLLDTKNPTIRSIGIAVDSSGTIQRAGFIKSSGAGYVVGATISGATLTDNMNFTAVSGGGNNLGKLVGIVAESDGSLMISDQTNNKIWKVDSAGALTAFATYTHPDLVAELPNGDFLTGGGTSISRISATDGTVTALTFTGVTFTYAGGMAYDEANHRLFIDDQTGGSGDTLDIVPYSP
jgi:hypothetical protein